MAHDVLVTLVQLFSWISVPLRRTIEWIWGQKPLVLVRHHSPQDAQGQLLGIWRSTVWHMTGSSSKPDLKALETIPSYEWVMGFRGGL